MDNTAPSETTVPDRRSFLRNLGVGSALSALGVLAAVSRADAQTVPPGSAAGAGSGGSGSGGGSGAGEGTGSNGSSGGASGGPAAAAGSAAEGSNSTTAGTVSGATTAGTQPAASTTTTIAAPKAPTATDLPLLKFAMQYELAIVSAYDAAISRIDGSSLTLDPALVPVIRVFRQHHAAYGEALSAAIGKTAPKGANAAILASIVGPFQSGSAADLFSAAASLENTAVATHLKLLGQIQSTGAATLLASVVPIEARHAVVFQAAGGTTDLIPATGTESLKLALDPSKYPSE